MIFFPHSYPEWTQASLSVCTRALHNRSLSPVELWDCPFLFHWLSEAHGSCCWVLPAQVLWKELSSEDKWKMQSHSGMSSDMLSMTPDISLLLLETEVICEWQTGATLSLLGYCSDTLSSEIDRFMYQTDWIYTWTWSPCGFDADLLVSHICW